MKLGFSKETQRLVKGVLIVLLVSFSAAAIIFSLVVIFTDFGKTAQRSSADTQGKFTSFAHKYINELHPGQASPGRQWYIESLSFQGSNYATVRASDGVTKTQLEFIYVTEGDKVRVLKLTDISDRDEQDAQLTLIRFLGLLHEGQFSAAAEFYGGPRSRLDPYGSESSPVSELLAGYCKTVAPSGACPRFTIANSTLEQPGVFQFVVRYSSESGETIAVAGHEEFTAVVKEAGPARFVVLSLPFD